MTLRFSVSGADAGSESRIALGAQTVTGPDVVLRSRAVYPIRMRLVDAATSMAVPACCTLKIPDGWVGRDPQDTDRFFALLQPDEFCMIRLRVEPPPGRSGWDRPDVFTRVSPYAERLEFVYPVRETFDAVVSPALGGGGVAGLRIGVLSIAGREVSGLDVQGDAHNRLYLRGLPHLRQEPLRVRVVHPTRRLRGDGEFILPETPPKSLDLPVELMAQFYDDPGPSSHGGLKIERRKVLLPASKPMDGKPARVRIRLRRHGGEPAVAARVWMNNATAKTDSEGRAVFEDVPPGVQVVTVRLAGFVAILARLTIPAGVEREFDLRESPGAAIRVTVVDAEGRPLPYAELDVRQASLGAWVDLTDGVQRIDRFTDHRGQRLLRAVQCGQVRVIATWGSRRNDVLLDLQPGAAEVPVRIVLPKSE